jgi:hypothetical protein
MPRRINWKEALGAALDCYRYFILGFTKKDDGGLVNLFEQVYKRTPTVDYYPAVSELCLDRETWLVNPGRWRKDEVASFALAFFDIVPHFDPNYDSTGSPRKFEAYEKLKKGTRRR